MDLKKIIAATVAAGTLSLGGGVAYATTSTAPAPSTPSSAPATTHCANAPARLAKLHAREAKLSARITALQAKDAAATSAGKTDRAQVIEARITLAQKLHDLVAARIQKLGQRCGVTQ